jgi:hypothetical protein
MCPSRLLFSPLLLLFVEDLTFVFALFIYIFLEFEVITSVTMDSIIFWDVTSCDLLEIYRRFSGMYCLYFRVEKWPEQAASHEYMCSLFLRNVGQLLPDYTSLHPREQYCTTETKCVSFVFPIKSIYCYVGLTDTSMHGTEGVGCPAVFTCSLLYPGDMLLQFLIMRFLHNEHSHVMSVPRHGWRQQSLVRILFTSNNHAVFSHANPAAIDSAVR